MFSATLQLPETTIVSDMRLCTAAGIIQWTTVLFFYMNEPIAAAGLKC